MHPEIERRLTTLEVTQADMAETLTDVLNRQRSHGAEIGHIQDRLRADEAVDAAHDAKWTNREKVIAAVASVLIAACAVLTFLHF